MRKRITTTNLENRQFDPYAEKLILNETIRDKDFTEYSFRRLKFSNCIIESTGFGCSNSENLEFQNCFLRHVKFSKSELEMFTFENCELIGVSFARSYLMDFYFKNCQLTTIDFIAAFAKLAVIMISISAAFGITTKCGEEAINQVTEKSVTNPRSAGIVQQDGVSAKL
jgi:uncharacterized protein YjbI with pentapeptide repeats